MAHNWMIAEREYLRQESRRGRRHAYEHLNPRTTALVVIDMVPLFADANVHCRDATAPINRLVGALSPTAIAAWREAPAG